MSHDFDHEIDHDIDPDIIANPPVISDGKSHTDTQFRKWNHDRFQCQYTWYYTLLHRLGYIGQ